MHPAEWVRWLGVRRRMTITRVSRPMTPAEEKAFDKVFGKMRETFRAMDDFIDLTRK